MNKILDTNILLDYPTVVETSSDMITIPIAVLKEIDGLKKHSNPEVASNARRAAVYISRNLPNITWAEEEDGTVDEQLLKITKATEGVLITNDVSLKVIATIQDIPTDGMSKKDDYTGIEEYFVTTDSNLWSEEVSKILETKLPPAELNMVENEYLIIKDFNQVVYDKGNVGYNELGVFRLENGELKDLPFRKIENSYIGKITPNNCEQKCLIDALYNSNVTILAATGKPGSGYMISSLI